MSRSFMLAPMAEISHRPLRELIESFGGCDFYFTEMISAGALIGGGLFEGWYTDSGPCPEKTVFQLVGGDSGKLAAAAAFLDKTDCFGIDINMGCSAPAITRTGAGVRWMESAEKAGKMISLVRKSVKKRLSVKLRTGLNDDFEHLVRFCKRLESEGVEFITLHPRTAKEKFKRKCKWEYVSALGRELKIPVAGNGDISSAEEMLGRSAECGNIMVGRLAVKNPWIFAQVKSLETNSSSSAPRPVFETGLRFLELLAKYQPKEFYISRARRFFFYFCDNLKWGNYLKNEINREESLSGIERTWQQYFAEHG